MVKLLIIVPSLKISGVTNMVKTLLFNLDTKVEPNVVVINRGKNDQILQNKLKQYDIPIYFVNDKNKKFLSFRNILRFKKIISSVHPNVVHSHSFKADIYQLFVNKKIKKISTAHNIAIEDFSMTYGKFTGILMTVIQMYIFRKLNQVVAVSDTVKNYLKTKKVDAITIYNGTEEKKKSKTNFFDDYERPIFVSTSVVNERKNIKLILDAFSENKIQGTLLIVGDGPLLRPFKDEYGAKNIIFRGFVSNVYDILLTSDIFISASKSEGLPLGAIEAMEANLPLVLSNIPQHLELRKSEKQSIIFFDNRNVDGVIKAMLTASTDFYSRKKTNSNKIYQNYFRSSDMGAKYSQIYISND